MILAIDTSAGTSVAVVDGDRVLAEREEHDTRSHAEVIGALIAGALADAGVSPHEIGAVAVGMGPGPFTGLRVGIAAARAFAFGAGVPVLPVVSHDAVALGEATPVLVVTDARRRELYWSAYAGLDAEGLPIRAHGPGLARPDDLPDQLDLERYRRLDVATIPAAAIGRLAAGLRRAGRPLAGEQALYLRSPDVTLAAAPKRVSA